MTDKRIDNIKNNQRSDKIEKPIKVYKNNPFLSMIFFIIGVIVLTMAGFLSGLYGKSLSGILWASIIMTIYGLVGMFSEKIRVFSTYTKVRSSFPYPFIYIPNDEIVSVETENYKNILIYIKNQDEKNTYEISLSNIHPEDRENIFRHFQGIAAKNTSGNG